MRTLLALLMVVAIAVPAFAAGNPNITAYVTFDSGAEVPRVDPMPYEAGTVYVCMKHIDVGFTTVSFAVTLDAGVSAPASWASLLPGGLSIGDWGTGITLSSTDCMTGEYVCIASGSLFYLGVPGEVKIVDHPDYPRWVVDCNDGVDFYCLEVNGGVLMDPTPTGEDCSVSPVEDATWGGIKALYR